MTPTKAIAIFGWSQTRPDTTQWADALTAGRLCAENGYAVVTGGYGGTMEAASQGAHEAGGHVIGVTAPAIFRGRSGANAFVTEVIEADSLSHRLDLLIGKSVGAVALSGSIGTAAELVVSWNTNHLARSNGGTRFPIAAVGPEWARVVATLSTELGALSDDVHVVADVEAALAWLFQQPEIH